MNKCPNCKNTPITFAEWNKGLNAFEFNCKSCGMRLKGNTVNYVLLVFTVLLAIVTLIIAHVTFDVNYSTVGIAYFALIIPPILMGSLLGYYFGGYWAELE